jgi:hypothetical protein
VATLLTWLVPGAGHLYLGRWRLALIGFVVIEGLYLLGLALSGGLFLEYLPPEMRGPWASVLTPEAGNLGALIWHVRTHPYLEQPQAWPAWMHLGTNLTAASGVLNALLMSQAHFDGREGSAARPGPAPALAALACWIFPGGGAWLQGRRARAVGTAVLLVGLFLLGTVLAEGSNLDRERHFYYWAGQFLLGLPAIVAEFLHGHPRLTSDVAYADAGVVLASVAGLLNVLSMLDAYSYSDEGVTRRASPRPREGEAEASA